MHKLKFSKKRFTFTYHLSFLMSSQGFFSAGTHGATGLHNEPLNSGVSPPATKTPFIPFIDKVMGNKSCLQPPPLRDLFNEKLVHIEYEGGNTIKPMVQIDNSVFEGRLCAPWENALFIKLLSKRVGYQTMIDRLRGFQSFLLGCTNFYKMYLISHSLLEKTFSMLASYCHYAKWWPVIFNKCFLSL